MDSSGSSPYNRIPMLTFTTLQAWVLSVMLALEPRSPYRETFEVTAQAVAAESLRSPLPGYNALKTASLLIALAWFESSFKVDAEGDCIREDRTVVPSIGGKCPPGSKPRSFGLYQIGESNFAGLHTTRAEVTTVGPATTLSLKLLANSIRICGARPFHERLAHYAGGGNGCPTSADPTEKSKHRVNKAIWITGRFPLTASAD